VHFQRTTPYPQMMNFDAPSSTLSCTRRERTDTPLQALNLMNDPVFVEAARGFAFRAMTEASGTFENRLDYAYRIALTRRPPANEATRLRRHFDDSVRNITDESARALFPVAIANVSPREAAAWFELSRVILNLDEFITRE